VGVRRLGGGVDRQLARDRVVLGDRAAGLDRRRVRARKHHVLLDHHLGLLEGAVGGHPVARLPVEDVVVGAALEVVADHRRAVLQRPLRVDHRLQFLVLDVDQFERVAGRVTILGDDEGDLLALEADLVGGQHRLHVCGDRPHPGHPPLLQVGAGEDGVDARVLQRRGGVDRSDAGVGEGAPQHRPMEHPGQLQVVDVAAEAADEAAVLLASQGAEADRPVLLHTIGDERGHQAQHDT